MTNTTAHTEALQVRTAAELAASAVAAVPADRWSAPSPCADHDVRSLVEHLAWGALLSRNAAERTPLERDWSSDEPPPFLAGLAPHGWAPAVARELRAAADAWAGPGAWEGETVMGTSPMPAAVVGPMMLAEFAVHGWDVARAVGAPYPVPEGLGRSVLSAVAGIAAMGRDGGWFGAEVPVPADAPAFARALGLAGRDPAWAPPA
ncbi:TIGR03086 family metal-binding protein [Geodermatophilus sp. SYSU D00815]